MGPTASWLLFVAIGSLLGAWMLFKRSPHLAVGIATAVALLAPTWLEFGSGPLLFDTRMTLAALMLVAYSFHPQGKLRYPLHWLDGVMVSLVVVHTLSDWSHNGIDLLVPVRAVGEWSVPYFAGRCVALYRNGITEMAPWFVGAAIVLGMGAAMEAYTGQNVWEQLFAPVDDLVQRSRELRYDVLYRASGPTRHPIFFAIVLLMMVPWAVAAIERGGRWLAAAGAIALVMIVVGMVATVSRGPLLALVFAALFAAAIRWRPVARGLLVAGGVGAVGLVLFWSQVIALVESTDAHQGRGKLVIVNDEAKVYTGTRNRLLVWEVYGPLVIRGGLLGYGTEAVSSFPPNIPGLPSSARSVETLGIVDNSYLLLGLRFGWLGCGLLVLMIGGAVVTAVLRRQSAGLIFYPHGAAFLTALASVLLGVGLEILTVFLSYEFGFWILFHCGVVAGLASLKRRLVRGELD